MVDTVLLLLYRKCNALNQKLVGERGVRSMKRDYDEVLGVSRNADAATIKKAYRKLAKKYHPDSNVGNASAEEHFKEVNEAYGVLGDEKKRKLYDQYGTAAFEEGFQPGSGYQSGGPFQGFHSSSGGPGGYQEFHFTGGDGADMDDILKNLFGGGFGEASGFRGRNSSRSAGGFRDADGFSGFGGSPFGTGRESSRGSDVTAEVELTFEEAALGGKKRVQLQDGTGKVQTLEINIPAGIDTGKTIRLKGKGNPGRSGAGDLLLKVTIKDKPGYERKGMDVYTTAVIPFTTAVFGGEAKVHTLYGDVLCKIKAGTQSGSKIRLRGKGIVSITQPSVHGDQYVTVQIAVPKNLTPAAAQKLKEFQVEYEKSQAGSWSSGHAAN